MAKGRVSAIARRLALRGVVDWNRKAIEMGWIVRESAARSRAIRLKTNYREDVGNCLGLIQTSTP
jgi:hypothetical protein